MSTTTVDFVVANALNKLQKTLFPNAVLEVEPTRKQWRKKPSEDISTTEQ